MAIRYGNPEVFVALPGVLSAPSRVCFEASIGHQEESRFRASVVSRKYVDKVF